MFGVGDVGHDLAFVFEAITRGFVRMIEGPGDEAYAGMRKQHLAGGEIVEVDRRGKNSHRNREERGNHHAVEHHFDALAIQVTGPDPDSAARVVTGRKKRQPADVVEVRVAVEEVQISWAASSHQFVAQQAQPGSAVENHQMPTAADLDARGVSAVTHGVRPRAGDAATYAPEPHRELRMDQGSTP